jgi:histone H3/H4
MVTTNKPVETPSSPKTPRAASRGLKLSPFRKLVRAIRPKYKWRRETLMEMKRRTEESVELLLKRSSLCAAHAGRNTVMPTDLALQALLLTLVPQEVTADPIPVGLANAMSNIKANLQLKKESHDHSLATASCGAAAVDQQSECESTIPPSTDAGSVMA